MARPRFTQTAFSQNDDVLAVEGVLVDLRFDGVLGFTVVLVQPGHADLVVEVTDVAHHALCFIALKWRSVMMLELPWR